MRVRPMDRAIKEKMDGPLRGVEVGVWKGDHANGLLEYLDLKKLYLVDPYEPYELLCKKGFVETPVDAYLAEPEKPEVRETKPKEEPKRTSALHFSGNPGLFGTR